MTLDEARKDVAELADDLDRVVEVVSTRDGDATARQKRHAAAIRVVLAALPPADDVTFWQLVADGVNHDPRCRNHFSGDPQGRECLRCENERLRASRHTEG